jgi:superoxide reductase
MQVFICGVCGHIEFSEVTGVCPVCFAAKEKFTRNDNVFKESQAKSPEAEVKHVPSVVLKKECGLIPEQACLDAVIRIGKTLHPSEEKHFIQFIDCYLDNKYIERIMLTPLVQPAGCVHIKSTSAKKFLAVEKCNIHGYWLKEVEI